MLSLSAVNLFNKTFIDVAKQYQFYFINYKDYHDFGYNKILSTFLKKWFYIAFQDRKINVLVGIQIEFKLLFTDYLNDCDLLYKCFTDIL